MQVEFYFSDANLPTDKHLLKQIQKDVEGYGVYHWCCLISSSAFVPTSAEECRLQRMPPLDSI